ncbi:MAG: hypothetical protein GF398_13815 [Chitinivibrionales bacterium]|nr:hypothetical protein [Chitinivibrionales bacterium]
MLGYKLFAFEIDMKNWFTCRRVFVALLCLAALVPLHAFAAKSGKKVRIIFEEQRIEGKIRRPQMVLIKADKRPEFGPMVIQSMGAAENLIDFVDNTIIEKSPYDGAFEFRDKQIINYTP